MKDDTRDSDVAFIKALAELLRENNLSELRVKREYGDQDSLDVRVARDRPAAPAAPQPAQPAAPAAPSSQSPAAVTSAPEVAPPSEPDQDPDAVTSPMVGTVYLSPEPGASPFVKPGDSVSEGDTLMIVEAMKTMNHIPAPRAGIVKSLLVEDGTPVEFGAPLVILG